MLEHILTYTNLDFAVSDILDEVSISKPKAYTEISKLEQEGVIKKSRIVGGTQLFKLDLNNPIVLQLRKSFEECLKQTINEIKRATIPIEAKVKIGNIDLTDLLQKTVQKC
jgi:DNA-binding Lrp family transcriptional regulator